jgi:hypothetical protein
MTSKSSKRLKSLTLLAAILVLPASTTATVVLSGTVQDCFNGNTVPVGHVNVSAFQVSKARKLMTQLKTMDQETFAQGDYQAMSRFDTAYTKMVSLVNSTNALARGASAVNGTVSFTVTAVDSVLVVGYADTEEDPFYYSYKTMRGLSNVAFALDMSRGSCSR